MRPTGDMTATTDEVVDRFNRAFQERDATLLEDIIAPDGVMESIQPAPDGTRYEVGPKRLRIISNGHVDSSERVLQYASAT